MLSTRNFHGDLGIPPTGVGGLFKWVGFGFLEKQ
jgi:hypothetical protein